MPGSLNAVIDLSHHNGSVNLKSAAAAGIVGVVQKATQGVQYTDPTYKLNRTKAQKAGLLWGAYHFGTGSEGTQQAAHFLDTVDDPKGMLLVLDFEHNPIGPSMTLEEARAFVTHVQVKTGVFPGLYGGAYLKQLIGHGSDSVLGQCWLWLAQYGPTAVVPPNWKTWTMWQYTDGAFGPDPHTVPGVGRCDRDLFNGSEANLKTLWQAVQ